MPIHREFLETMLNRRKITITPLRLQVLECILNYREAFTIEQVCHDLEHTTKVDAATVSHLLIQFNRSELITRLEDEEVGLRRSGRKVVRYVWLSHYIRTTNRLSGPLVEFKKKRRKADRPG
ncbi:hypothetical protein [Chryseolinea lacunae]|uniref:Ferric uptake regulator family protein n=1 Tax=Chryseolinea lacunae TaxID=2801331 RepID=A0ABS1KMG9_9BACT|nr:hypothetical protein [Chryseolinea lacunae]MBL0740442.1 hypothetical protein [Chryseolinea lacunae]